MVLLNTEHIHQKIFDVYKDCDIHSFPIDCFSILAHYGFRIVTYQEIQKQKPDLYTAVSNYSEDAFRFRMTIYYNSIKNTGRSRFSLMHELGHYILGHTEETDQNEDEADYFASCMLAPRVAIKKMNCSTAEDLHTTFGLSYAAANRTIVNYNEWCKKERTSLDNHLSLWIFDKETYLKHQAALIEWQKVRRKTRRQLEERERIVNMFIGYYQTHGEEILERQRLGFE